MESCELSIVMPCLNEEKTLPQCIAKAKSFLEKHNVHGEIVIADNGSTDHSREVAQEAGARVVDVQERGYGSAILGGMAAAKGKYIIVGDADDSYDFSSLSLFLEKLREGYDMVIGNRFQGGVMPGAMPFLHRYLGNPLLSWIGNLFFRSPIHDFHCGLRAVRADAVPTLDLHATGMEFATEMVVKAIAHRLQMTEVPVVLYPDGREKRSHLRTWRDGWRHLRLLLLYSPNWIFLYPGIFFIITGGGVGLWLLPGQRYILDVHTLLYAAALVILGVNALSCGLIAKVFAIDAGLLPPTPLLKKVYGRYSLEIGVLVGFVLLCVGIGISAYAFWFWDRRQFSDLNPQQVMRMTIPAVTLILIGFQIIFSSLFLIVLRMQRVRHSSRSGK